MTILTISGSFSEHSSNRRLLRAIAEHNRDYIFSFAGYIIDLPLFSADKDHAPFPKEVVRWRRDVEAADGIIISTPVYLHNIPAVLKNALEWLTVSGELYAKPTLAFTFTPHPPRGTEAMKSLLWSLGALNARIVAQCSLYQSQLSFDQSGHINESDQIEIIEEAMGLLIGSR